MNYPKIIMLVGAPGAGKSTWIKKFLAVQDNPDSWVIASTDDYVAKLAEETGVTYDDAFGAAIKEATKNLAVVVSGAIAARKNVIWDQTNMRAKVRMGKISQFPKEYFKTAVVFPVPIDLEARLKSRPGKTIPKYIVDGMIKSYEEPSLSEGFDVISLEK